MSNHAARHSAPTGSRLRAVAAAVPSAIARAIAGAVDAPGPPAAESRARRPVATGGGESARRTSAPTTYTVVVGDTVSSIADRFGLSTARVLAMNGLSWSSNVFPGQRLALADTPAPAAPPAAAEIEHCTIRPGDTIAALAAAHGLSVDDVLSANGLGPTSIIYPGQSIALPAP